MTADFDPVIGGVLNLSNTTGMAIAAGGGATATNAVFTSERIDGGIAEDGTTGVGVAYVDFPGGL